MKESDFQRNLKKELEERFPGSIVMKSDSSCIQGIPDLLILYGSKWASLEVKRNAKEARKPRPNQEHYVEVMNKMSYSSFIYPENKEEVLDGLSEFFC